jgi:hypothetical protein
VLRSSGGGRNQPHWLITCHWLNPQPAWAFAHARGCGIQADDSVLERSLSASAPTHMRVSMHTVCLISLLRQTSAPQTPQAWDEQPSPPALRPQRAREVPRYRSPHRSFASHAPGFAGETGVSRGRGSGLVPWSQLRGRQLPPRACWETERPAATAFWWAYVATASERAWPGCCGRSRHPARTPHRTTWTTRRRTTAVDTRRGWRRSPASSHRCVRVHRLRSTVDTGAVHPFQEV